MNDETQQHEGQEQEGQEQEGQEQEGQEQEGQEQGDEGQEQEGQEQEGQEQEGQEQEGQEQEGQEQEGQGQAAPQWVKELRQRIRESERARKEAEAKLAALTEKEEPLTLGKKPELVQFDFDTDKYEAALEKWYADKQKIDAANAAKVAEEEKAKQEWNDKLEAFKVEKTALKLPDYDEREEDVSAILSIPQQSIIVKYAASPAKLIHRLGGNAEELLSLSKIQDPIQFALAISKMEDAQMKTAPGKKKPPVPERTPTGSSGVAVSGDTVLERLRAEADKSGDYTKVNEYRRKKRDQQK